jgi:hypothetical protein
LPVVAGRPTGRSSLLEDLRAPLLFRSTQDGENSARGWDAAGD